MYLQCHVQKHRTKGMKASHYWRWDLSHFGSQCLVPIQSFEPVSSPQLSHDSCKNELVISSVASEYLTKIPAYLSFFLLNFRLALQPEKEPQQVRYERDSWGKTENPALLISIHIIHATGLGMSGDITVARLIGLMKKSRLNYLYIFQGNGGPKESEIVWMGCFSSQLAVLFMQILFMQQ